MTLARKVVAILSKKKKITLFCCNGMQVKILPPDSYPIMITLQLDNRSQIEGRVRVSNGGQNLVDFQRGQQKLIFLPAKWFFSKKGSINPLRFIHRTQILNIFKIGGVLAKIKLLSVTGDKMPFFRTFLKIWIASLVRAHGFEGPTNVDMW